MIEFMVLGPPRSGTTWAANWLTNDFLHCYHDPLARIPWHQLDKLKASKTLGIAGSGFEAHATWVNCHPAKKIILHRDITEVNGSLLKLGFPLVDSKLDDRLYELDGWHVHWKDLFNHPQEIMDYFNFPFDIERHAELLSYYISPHFAKIPIDFSALKENLCSSISQAPIPLKTNP